MIIICHSSVLGTTCAPYAPSGEPLSRLVPPPHTPRDQAVTSDFLRARLLLYAMTISWL